MIIGTALATKRARRMGLDLDRLNSFITWMLVVGFVCGHVLDEIFYHPDEIMRARWLANRTRSKRFSTLSMQSSTVTRAIGSSLLQMELCPEFAR